MAAEPRAMPGPLSGLSVKLITIIVAVILTAGIVIYLPLVANYRDSWLADRLRVGIVAARVLDAVPDVMALPQTLTDRLLNSAGAKAIVYRRGGQSQLLTVEGVEMPKEVVVADMRATDPATRIVGALDTLLAGNGRTLRIVGDSDGTADGVVEVLMSETPLRLGMLAYSRNIALLSLVIAAVTAIALYVFVSRTFIAPIRRITANMVAYRQAPENANLIIQPEPRNDEIGIAERELAAMQTDLFSMLRQRRHLADLGLAVAKINHDLRNTLTSAQLLSDQVATLDDPKVQRLAPRLVTTLDKAIGFAQSVLDYGRQSATPPKPGPVDLHLLVDESAIEAGLMGHPEIRFINEVPDDLVINADADQLGRIFVNLLKNARQAFEANTGSTPAPAITTTYSETADELTLTISDNGPGLPPRAKENLFVAFQGSARAGGTGLGLAIARELIEAHGGKLVFVDQPKGARFDVILPIATRLH
ncbi:sensor histidine kinase [Paradevosia shaoguanensis]|uniref:sensor histidine kinase n=1 Tax=Paradevosia shaoguanensis TaxID=1335043 RepID=UPI003C7114A0